MILIGNGLQLKLSPNETVIFGRDRKTCKIPLISKDHPQHISRQHLELKLDENGKVRVRDLRSANGSYLDGDRLGLSETEWEIRKTLEIGTSGEFKFKIEQETKEEDETVKILRDTVEGAKKRKRRFMNILKIWKPDERKRFLSGLSHFPEGDGRLVYLQLVGLTAANLTEAKPASLRIAAANLGLSENSPPERFLAFIDGKI